MRQKVLDEKLKEMKSQGIIEKVNGTTPWLTSLMHVIKKDLRIVLDKRFPNQALERRRV